MDFAGKRVELSAWQDNLQLQEQEDQPSLQKAYLGRLRRLLRLRSDHHDDLNDQGLWLLDRSIFTTYCDCVEVGVGFVAQEIICRFSPRGEVRPAPQ
jgi:hypothetical protein